MTTEEALRILDTIPTISEQVDALEMAIKALEQQPCDDCISRQRVLNDLENVSKGSEHPRQAFVFVDECVDYITSVSPVTPQRLKGKWIEVFVETPNDPYSHGFKSHKCSKCGHRPLQILNYCPKCGADMREGEDKE